MGDSEQLEAGRRAFAERRWSDARERLTLSDERTPWPRGAEHGYVGVVDGIMAMVGGDADRAAATLDDAVDLGRRGDGVRDRR